MLCRLLLARSCRRVSSFRALRGALAPPVVEQPAADESASSQQPATGGWFAPQSIEARCRVRRQRPAGATASRSRAPSQSEEDAYLAAGAPGYDSLPVVPAGVDASLLRLQREAQQRLAAGSEAAATSASAVALSENAPVEPRYGVFSRRADAWPVVRTSTGRVAMRNLPALIRSFQLAALPVYERAPGCLGATLWVGSTSTSAAPAEICAAALAARVGVGGGVDVGDGGGDGDGTAPVTAVTTWHTQAHLDAAVAGDEYRSAMAALAPFFRDRPTTAVMRQVAASATAAAAATATKEEEAEANGVGVS